MQFTAKTFVHDVTGLLSSGMTTLDSLISAYRFGFDHIKEIHKYNPGYTQGWLEDEIKKVFNVDVRDFALLCRRLGGGSSEEQKARGFDLVRRFGFWDCYRANRLLTVDQMKKLGDSISEKTTSVEFVQAIDQMADVLKNKGDDPDPIRVDWKKECLKARAKISELQAELRALKLIFARLKIKAEVTV